MDWMDLAQDGDELRAIVILLMNLRVSYNAGNFVIRLETVRFSRRTLLHGVTNSIIYAVVRNTAIFHVVYG
jgi:hypothetical protein